MTLYIIHSHIHTHTRARARTRTHVHTHTHTYTPYILFFTRTCTHTLTFTHRIIPCFLFYDRQIRKFGGSRFPANATIILGTAARVYLRTYVFRQSENRGTVDQEASINADLRALASYFSFIDFPFCSGRRCESVIVSARKEKGRERESERRPKTGAIHTTVSTTRVAA